MYLLYLSAWKLIGLLPERMAYKLANFVADQIYRKNGKGIQRLRSNYQRVKPGYSKEELEKLTKLGMRSYMRYWFDTFRLNKWSKERIIKTTKVNDENLYEIQLRTNLVASLLCHTQVIGIMPRHIFAQLESI